MESSRDHGDPLDADLARRMDWQVRIEMESAERDASDLADRRRGLVDIAWEAVQAGHRVQARIGTMEMVGLAVYARGPPARRR